MLDKAATERCKIRPTIMTTILEIESAIAQLSRPELDKFREWFSAFDGDAWDLQFEEDARGGKLDRIADQALKDFEEGRCTDCRTRS